MCTCRNSRITGCSHTRVRWISCRTKEIGSLKLSNTLAAQQSQYVCPFRLSITDRDTLKCHSLTWTFFSLLLQPGPQKCGANWVAGIPQLVFGTRNTLGQHWRLQKGTEPGPAGLHHTSKSTCSPKLFFCSFILFFEPVPAGCWDVVWLPEQTQSQSGPKISKQQEQLWGSAGHRGTTDRA